MKQRFGNRDPPGQLMTKEIGKSQTEKRMNSKPEYEDKMKKYIFVTIMLAVFTASFTTFATDAKIVGGAMCKNEDDGEADDLNYTYGILEVTSTQDTVDVECPLIRDNVNGRLQDVYVYVYDSSSTLNLECNLTVRDSTGARLANYLYGNSSGTGNQYIAIDASSWPDVSQGYYSLWCRVPDGSKIYEIRWREN